MNWENYDLSYAPTFILSQEADIYPHRFCDYFEAIAQAGLTLAAFRQIHVDHRIKDYLTPESFAVVKGRYQVAIFHSLLGQIPPLLGQIPRSLLRFVFFSVDTSWLAARQFIRTGEHRL